MLFSILSFSQEQPPNQNFENWVGTDSLVNWNSAVFYDAGFPIGVLRIPLATRDDNSIQGSYAVKMETQDVYNSGTIAPGMIMLGNLNLENEEMPISGGIPFADRPLGLSVFTKYTPANNDTAYLFAYMTKWNEATQTSDTIGGTMYYFTDTIAEYTELLLPFIYQSVDTCDTLNIIFTSSSPFAPQVGSTLFVDSLQMVYEMTAFPTLALPATDVTETEFTANWVPSPYSFDYYLDVATDSNFVNPVVGYDNVVVDTNFLVVTPPTKTQEYFYRVRVKYGDTAVSVNSNVISTQYFSLNPPVCLIATDTTSTSFTANWTKCDEALSYNLEVASDETFSTLVSGYDPINTTDTTHSVTGLIAGGTYYYRVKTIYSAGESVYSNIVMVSTIDGLDKINNLTDYLIKDNSIILNNLPNNATINIYDITGKTYFNAHINSNKIEIPISDKGVYLLEVKTQDEVWRLKFTM